MKKKAELMTSEEVSRALKRMAHEVIEKNKGAEDIVILGVLNGGLPIAEKLADLIQGFEDVSVPRGGLDIKDHRDDIDVNSLKEGDEYTEGSNSDIPVDITEKNVILVDDVLYTGRSVRAAMDALSDYGRAGSIQLAVLVDRGHRELPIRADFVGKNIPTSHSETVVVESGDSGNLVVNIYEI